MNSTTKPALPRILGVAFEIAAVVGATIGDPDDPALGRQSPVNSANMSRVPVLLLHGQDDTVVPISHSDSMARVLKEGNVSVTYLKLPGEDHWLSHGAIRLQALTEIDRFLAAHLLVEK